MSTIEKMSPYIDRLMNDTDLQDSLRKTARTGGAAARRARSKGNAKKAAKDPKVRQQALTALLTAREAARTLSEPERKPKSRWLKRLLVLGVIGGIVYLVANEEAREKLMEAAGIGAEGSTPAS